MKKMVCTLGMGLLMAGAAQAAVVSMPNLNGNGSYSPVTFDGGAVAESVTLTTNGHNLVHCHPIDIEKKGWHVPLKSSTRRV
ncbi:hypothetical protein PDESU_01733 [Pontiella desulfatans]|uniref:Uncharacterized protein n=1 Tax=Pontiella desulfatans TaxID=2750659 RepID=A0A6C2U034_PONDE|nr:hypothetical protein [Pontiella desulfatans]VGO13179.1 hypothetical protein PDESU_01733 [Pontiella desulfatans]